MTARAQPLEQDPPPRARAAATDADASLTGELLSQAVQAGFEQRSSEIVLIHHDESRRRSLTGRHMADLTTRAAGRIARAKRDGARTMILQLGNTPDFVAYLLACWSCDVIPLPMSPAYSVDYLAERVSGRVPAPVMTARSGDGEIPIDAVPAEPAEPANEIWAYALPTGGTEGNPRIVPVPDAEFGKSLRGLAALSEQGGWRPGQRQSIFGALDHAASFRYLLLGLRDGNCIILTKPSDGERFIDVMLDERVEWTHLTPLQMAKMASSPRFDDLRRADWLAGILHTSARCPRPLKRRWIEAIGPERVTELYSFTEMAGATIIAGADWLRHSGSVGQGFGTQIRILDDQQASLPPFEIGKVFLRSGLSRTLKRSFMASRVEMTSSGFYFLGDYGWLDEDGFLYICGIRERVVDEAGQAIYVDLIEDCILDGSGVAEACVTIDRQAGSPKIVAHVVPQPGVSPTDAIRNARDACRATLASAMWPEAWRAHVGLPRSNAGKIVRNQLATQDPVLAVGSTLTVASSVVQEQIGSYSA